MTGADRWIYRNDYRLSWGWFKYLPTMVGQILRHWIERAMRGYSTFDMYDGSSYMADVIAGSAYWLFVNAHGHPDRMTHEEWLDILLEIRDGFSTRDEHDNLQIPERAWELLRENFKSIWD